jgi:hypothetical protein
MWEIIQSIYITSLEDQSNDQSKIPESSSFGVHLELEFSSIDLDLDSSSKALKLTYSPSCSLELSHGSWPRKKERRQLSSPSCWSAERTVN